MLVFRCHSKSVDKLFVPQQKTPGSLPNIKTLGENSVNFGNTNIGAVLVRVAALSAGNAEAEAGVVAHQRHVNAFLFEKNFPIRRR